jgi:hypothetical protein
MELIQSKSLLAKLMATENLIVEQRNVATASFDVQSRVLTVPTLDKNISAFLYDLFMGHEVGHALYTPLEGMKRARDEKISMSIANVVEDCRIERKVKNKYPGIRSSFVRAYRELIEQNFFGTAGVDLNELNFIDRLNLYTKGGAAQGIKFTEYEKSLVDLVEKTESYDNVIETTRIITKYMKEVAEEQRKKNAKELSKLQEDENGEDEFEDVELDEDGELTGDEDIDMDLDSNEEDSSEDSTDDTQTGHQNGIQDEDLKSFTDEAYRQNEQKLFSKDSQSYYYGNIPNVNLNDIIIEHKVLWKRFYSEAAVDGYISDSAKKEFQKIRNDSKKVVGYLAKEFELRKNADQLKRASIAKTGDLNMNRIYAYQLTDDIFKKITVVPGAKSHGLIMFLDWSGSMGVHIDNTVKQLINLVMFCKKVNIPFEVYAFSSEYHDENYLDNYGKLERSSKEGDIKLDRFNLLNILSSRMSAGEFKNAGSGLIQVSNRFWRPNWFGRGGTPLNETIISAMKIVPEFQKRYKLQIVNTVFLTDGDGHSNNEVYYKMTDEQLRDGQRPLRIGHRNSGPTIDEDGYKKIKKLILRDPITKLEQIPDYDRSRELTAAYIKMLKARTNCNILGFYVLSGRELGRELYKFYPGKPDSFYNNLRIEFRKNKATVVTSSGFDEYYLLRSNALDTNDDVEFEVKENVTTRGLVSAFSKYTGNRLSNRVVLNRFIGMIT